MSKSFHAKLLDFATGMGMGGLGYLEIAEDMSYKGPIDKFIPDEYKPDLAQIAALQPGDTIFFIADKPERANYYAGQLRTELGEKLDLCEKMLIGSVISMIFQCLSWTQKQNRLALPTIRFLCHRGDLRL